MRASVAMADMNPRARMAASVYLILFFICSFQRMNQGMIEQAKSVTTDVMDRK